jgi:hypothetical protein
MKGHSGKKMKGLVEYPGLAIYFLKKKCASRVENRSLQNQREKDSVMGDVRLMLQPGHLQDRNAAVCGDHLLKDETDDDEQYY